MYTYFDAPQESPFKAVPLEFRLARLKEAEWTPGPHAGLKMRDCLLGESSQGQMMSRHVKAEAAGFANGWADHGSSFQFLFVTEGSLTIETDSGEALILNKGDSAIQKALAQKLTWTSDFEAFDIVAPVPGTAVTPVEILQIPVKDVADIRDLISHDVKENYFSGKGPRRFFVYRDLHTLALTDRRIHVHLVRATEVPPGGTGWHVHSMSQIFYVIRGWVDIAVDDVGVVRMEKGDAMCVANGMRHNVFAFSPDYDVLEMCLPGDYSTVPTPAPEGIGVPVPTRQDA